MLLARKRRKRTRSVRDRLKRLTTLVKPRKSLRKSGWLRPSTTLPPLSPQLLPRRYQLLARASVPQSRKYRRSKRRIWIDSKIQGEQVLVSNDFLVICDVCLTGNPGRKTEEGFSVFKEAELGINPEAGGTCSPTFIALETDAFLGTPRCPFDCDCCKSPTRLSHFCDNQPMCVGF